MPRLNACRHVSKCFRFDVAPVKVAKLVRFCRNQSGRKGETNEKTTNTPPDRAQIGPRANERSLHASRFGLPRINRIFFYQKHDNKSYSACDSTMRAASLSAQDFTSDNDQTISFVTRKMGGQCVCAAHVVRILGLRRNNAACMR